MPDATVITTPAPLSAETFVTVHVSVNPLTVGPDIPTVSTVTWADFDVTSN